MGALTGSDAILPSFCRFASAKSRSESETSDYLIEPCDRVTHPLCIGRWGKSCFRHSLDVLSGLCNTLRAAGITAD